MPRKSSTSNTKEIPGLFSSIFDGNFSKLLNEEKFNKFLNGIYGYFSEKKNNIDFGLLENGTIKEKNFSKCINILNYLNECLNKFENIPLDKIILVRTLNSAIRTKSLGFYKDINNDLYPLILSSINVTNNTIQFASSKYKETFANNTIFNYLSDEVRDLGEIVLELRKESHEHKIIEEAGAKLINNTIKYIPPNQAKEISYVFISQFHLGIEDIEGACQELLGSHDCYYPESADVQYHAILRGRFPLNTANALAILEKLHSNTSSNQFVIFYSEDEILNFLTYFSSYVTDKNTQQTGISEYFVDVLSLWIHTLPNTLQNIQAKPDVYSQLFSLVEKIIADPHFTTQKFFKITTAINSCLDLMKELLKTSGYDSTADSFASLFDQINKKEQISAAFKLEYAAELKDLSLICLQHESCNATLVLKKFTDVLGTITNRIPAANRNEIEDMVQLLLKNATDKISGSESKEIAINFIKKYTNETQLTEKCASLFNFIDCKVNTKQITSSISPVVANQTISVNIENPPLTKENNNTNPILANFGLTLATAAAHGVGSGMLNGIIQYFATKYSRHGEQSSKAKAIAIYSSLLAHAAFSATFPLMLYTIQEQINQGNEDKAQELWNNLMVQAPLTFASSVVISLGLQRAYECTQLLSNRFVRAIAQNTLPVAGTGVSLFYNPGTTAVQIATSILSSSLTRLGLNKFFPIKQQPQFDTEANNANVNYNAENNKTNIITNGKVVSENEAKRTHQYICLPELDEVKKHSRKTLDQLKRLEKTCEDAIQTQEKQINDANTPDVSKALSKSIYDNTHILSIMRTQFTLANTLQEELEDDMHIKACDIYPSNRKKEYVAAMDKLGNVFKLMRENFKNLQNTLKEAIGYTDAASGSFSADLKNQLNELFSTVDSAASKVTIYKDRYSNADAVVKTEIRCKAEANRERFNVLEKNVIPTRNMFNNANGNRNTIAFSNDSKSNSST